ncbi:MAG: penicillin-binding protein activator [Thermoproteota archaeon]|nr:penicillin-binding protein activator [Thermoproteota archaeon]
MNLNRRTLFLGLIIAIIISDSIIFFAEIKSKSLYSNWIITINASIAAVLAISVLYRRKNLRGVYRKTRIALAIGLSSWLCADIVWAIYEIVLELVPPVPSVADFLWLAAYGFLAYYLFVTYIQFHKKFKFSRRTLIVSILGSAIFLSYTIGLTINFADLSSPRGIAMFGVISAYPILDAILMVPAIVILINFRKEPLWFTPWICESAGIFLMALSDSWFAPIILTSFVNQLWLSSLFFAAHYLVIAAGLLWYIKFLAAHEHEHEDDDHPKSDMRVLKTSSKAIITTADTNNENKNDIFEKNKNKNEGTLSPQAIHGISVIAIIAGLVGIIIVIVAYTLYPTMFSSTSAFFSWFINTNSEVVFSPPNTDLRPTVTFGAILPLTSISSSLGEAEEAALQIAVKDVNAYFSKINSTTRIELIVKDTQTNPAISLEMLKQLAAKGIKIVIGPATSAELQAIRKYANETRILLISPSSTAPSVVIRGNNEYNDRISGNNVIRLVPDDTHQAQAVSQQMWNDGIRVVIPFWRTDVYGNGLVDATIKHFQQLGGKVIDGVGYVPHTGDFSASLNRINFIIWDQELKSLDYKVNQAISQYGANKVGVYIVAFDEIAPIFIQAQYHSILSTVKWYGSDGSAINDNLVRNIEAAKFALKTNFANPIYGVENDNDDKFKHVEEEIHKIIERPPRSYASVAYDILWIASLAENDIKTNATHNDIDSLKKTFERIAKSYKGITGNTTLNSVGDRKYGDYDFWAIRDSNNDGDSNHETLAWKRVSKYIYNTTAGEGVIQTIPTGRG